MGKKMKLFVIGEDTPDPDKWSIWSGWRLVLAPDLEAALALVDRASEIACEIPMDKPLVLAAMQEPNWQDDL